MPREAPGQFKINRGKDGVSYTCRLRLPDGRRVHESLGKAYGPAAITETEARDRMRDLQAQIRLGRYLTRAERAAAEVERRADTVQAILFGEYAERWAREHAALRGQQELSRYEQWRFPHLHAWFAGLPLAQIDVTEVRRFAAAKRAAPVGDGGLGATSTNKVLQLLSAILEDAVDEGLIARNPASRFRVPGERYVAPHITRAAQIRALLDAASDVDTKRRSGPRHARALLATLVFAGLRADEALSLRWRDVNLADGYLRVHGTKTLAAERQIKLLPPLREELADLKARTEGERGAFVFATGRGTKVGYGNFRRRVFGPAIEIANDKLDADGHEMIPTKLTPHGLRHTYASILVALGEDVHYVAEQLGHADAGFTLRAYCKSIPRWDGERGRLRLLIDARDGNRVGETDPTGLPTVSLRTQPSPGSLGAGTA